MRTRVAPTANTRATTAKHARTVPLRCFNQAPQDAQKREDPAGWAIWDRRTQVAIGDRRRIVTPQVDRAPNATASPKSAINGMPVSERPANTRAVVKLAMPQGFDFSSKTALAEA